MTNSWRLRFRHTGCDVLRWGKRNHRTEQSRGKEEQSHHHLAQAKSIFARGVRTTKKREDRFESQLVHTPVTYVLLKICSDVMGSRVVTSLSFFQNRKTHSSNFLSPCSCCERIRFDDATAMLSY